jgi:hypothetical protein
MDVIESTLVITLVITLADVFKEAECNPPIRLKSSPKHEDIL